VRLRVQDEAKRAIARVAAAMVGDGEAVALDSEYDGVLHRASSSREEGARRRHERLRVAMVLADAPASA